MPRSTRQRTISPNLTKAADRGSLGSRSAPLSRPDLSKPQVQGGGLGATISREYNNAFPGITNKETVSVGFNDLFKQNRISGSIDPQSSSAKLDIGLGIRGLGTNLGIGIDFRDGWVPNVAIDFGAKVAGVGGNIGVDTRGGGKIGLGVGIGSIDIARDKEGNTSANFCAAVPGLEICNEYSRTKKDPQSVPVTPRPIKPKPTSPPKPKRPVKPNAPVARPRKKPVARPKKKPIAPKRPSPPTKLKPVKPERPVKPIALKPPKTPKPPKSPKPTPPKRPTPPPSPPKPTPPKRPNPWPRPVPGDEYPPPIPPVPPPGSPMPPMPVPPSPKPPTPPVPQGSKQCTYYYTYRRVNYYHQGDPGYEFGEYTVLDSNGRFGTHWNSAEASYNYKINDPYIPPSKPQMIRGTSAQVADFIAQNSTTYTNSWTNGSYWKFGTSYQAITLTLVSGDCPLGDSSPPPYPKPRLPDPPPKIKPMKDCCDKIEDIYKYLGIAKLKKKKFPVAKAFMVPGGTGNEDCEDYYAMNQALFRMLANGLIINPVSKPLGSEWKSVNATAWAGQVYEMAAEAMSNGNSSQKYEISMIMQITQLLSIISELTRKVEFLSEALGIDPDLDTEEVPACFTIYEGHKGFEKKEPKKIDIAKAKTDDDIEAILGKMLKPSKIPVTKWVLNSETKSIIEILREQ